MSARTLSLKFLSAGIALCALVSAAPAKAAPLVVTTSRFSLTFQDGWTTFPFGNDTLKVVMNPTINATAYMAAVISDHPMTAQELSQYMAMYGAADSLEKTAEGTKTIGGKSFTYVEYKSTKAGDEDGRYRFYYTHSGNLLFNTNVGYEIPDATAAIAQVEAALATLTLNSTNALRASALRGPAFRPATHDVLGRSGFGVRPVRLFGVPAL